MSLHSPGATWHMRVARYRLLGMQCTACGFQLGLQVADFTQDPGQALLCFFPLRIILILCGAG